MQRLVKAQSVRRGISRDEKNRPQESKGNAASHQDADRCEKKREELAGELIEEITKEFKRETPPAWETVVKKISEARNRANGKDVAWGLGTLDDYPLSPLAVANIFALKTTGLRTISIRDAVWFDRLSMLPIPSAVVRLLAQQLSTHERIFELTQTKNAPARFNAVVFENTLLHLLASPQEQQELQELVEHRPEGYDAADLARQLVAQLKALNQGGSK
jgi:hypothetical protein